nr:hypothetical protein RKHAN_04114 [Rhizobium sp. Khangiran2]
MTDKSRLFRQLACSDMVRKAAQAKHQPIPNDDRIDALLKRLAEAGEARENGVPSQPSN